MGDKECVARDVTNRYAYHTFHNHSSRQVDMSQVFLPFATDAKGQTRDEKRVEEMFWSKIDNFCVKGDIMGRDCSRVERKRRSYCFHTEE